MTHEQKITYMRIAAGICGFSFKPEHLDLLVSMYEVVLEKEGEGTISDLCKIEAEVKERYQVKPEPPKE